jgi:glycosyltransferase involved in cell wall biosynthesis
MIAMFKNEASVLRRMLDSTLGFCDYYVMQNNGSTDGSDEIARQFLIENGLSGEVYVCEEGWQGFGWNRDHLIRYCQEKVNHGCDWILKMDCDEVLEVDDDFDWSPFYNTNTETHHY